MPGRFTRLTRHFRSKSSTVTTSPGHPIQLDPSNSLSTSQTVSTPQTVVIPQTVVTPQTAPPTHVTTQSSSPAPVQQLSSQLDLWRTAEQQLSPKRQEIIRKLLRSSTGLSTPGHDTVAQLQSLAEDRRNECEKQQWKFSFRGKEIILRDLAEKTIVWLTKFREIGDIVVNYDPVHLALPWAGVRFLLQCAVQDSQQMGVILTGLEMITRLVDRAVVYEELYLRSPVSGKPRENLRKSLIDLYRVILEFLADVCRLYDLNPAKKMLSTIFNPEKLVGVLQDLTGLDKLVRCAAKECESVYNRGHHADLHRKANRLNTLLRDLGRPILRTDRQVTALLRKLEDHERSALLCWLSSIPHEDNHKNAKSGRAPSTGQWLLKHDRYRAWRRSSASTILWLHGIPGAGKTKLVTHVVDDLIECFKRHPNDEGFAYFYCDRNDRDRQDPLRVMQSFIKQLATPRANDMLQSSVVDLYLDKKKSGFASKELDMKECQDLLYQFIDLYPQTTIVLDALDECSPRTRVELIKILDESVGRALRPIKIFISSREDDDIKRRFEGGPNVAVSATDNVGDISAFVTKTLEEANQSRSMKISPQFQGEIISTLTRKSQGMCQWAALQVNQLLEIDLEDDMRARLGRLPQDLEQTYDEIYAKITKPGGRTTAMARRAFLWVMQAQVPLSPHQLVAASCQDSETATANVVDVDISFVLKICHNLVVVDHELHVCRFAHLSVQEYLEKNHLKQIDADYLISKVCLRLLVEDPNDGQDLMRYVVLYWPWHVQRCEGTEKRHRLTRPLMRFLGSPTTGTDAYQRWCDGPSRGIKGHINRSGLVEIGRYLEPASLPVLAMCCLGLFHTLEQWWNLDFIDPSTLNAGNVTLLQLAVRFGHFEICEWLVDHGANVNAGHADQDHNPGIIVAAGRGRLDIVQLLLTHGADVNAGGGGEYHSSALVAATEKGHLDIVRLLLCHGADVNAEKEGGLHSSALIAASGRGYLDIVQLLLTHGANITARRKQGLYSSAVVAASAKGHLEIVQLFLSHTTGVRAGAEEDGYSSALIAASIEGHLRIAQLLVTHGADVNAERRGLYSSALIAASIRGHLDIVRLLLSHGADVNARREGGYYSFALVAASAEGHVDVVELLLSSGADMNAERDGELYSSALIAASVEGHFDIVQLLLTRGACVNAGVRGYYSSALMAASQRDYPNIVQLLLSHGAR